MLDWIKSILDNYTNGMYFPNIHIKDVIEILIVAVIVYEIHALDQEYKSVDAS